MNVSLLDAIRRLLPPTLVPTPALTPAHARATGEPVQFASSGGGGGGRYDDDDAGDGDYYDDAPEPGPEDEPIQPARRADQQATAARRRTVQSEPDDRYWTDYLRIALPVIGLLLVIAVFWYWAQQLIDDDAATDLTPTEPGLAEVVGTATEEPAEEPAQTVASPPGDTTTGEGAPPDQATTEADGQEVATPPNEEPEEVAQDGGEDLSALIGSLDQAQGPGGIQPDSTVVVSDAVDTTLNLRSSETTAEDNIVAELTPGTELTVVSGPSEAEGITWWEVVTGTGQQGWVSAEFIEPAG